MIPNITRGGRTSGLMAYLAGPGRSDEHVNAHLVAGDAPVMSWHGESELSPRTALQVGWELDHPRRAFGTRVTVPVMKDGHKVGVKDAHVWHCSLSLHRDEGELSDEMWAHISEEFVAGMGFADPASEQRPCRWVAVRHGRSKTGNDHVHIVVSLVHEDGRKAKVWEDRPRAQQLAGELERKYGLRVLESREKGTSERGYKPAEREIAARTQLAPIVRDCAAQASSEADFVSRVANTPGVRIRPRFVSEHQDVVTGYSVALVPCDGRAPTWHGGGAVAPELALPRLRATWPDTPQHASAAIPGWQAAWRNQPVSGERQADAPAREPRSDRERVALTLRGCAAGSRDEAEFVRRARQAGLRIRPRFARDSTSVVTGYSVGLRAPSAGEPVWYGGGHVARDLTLPRLRQQWATGPEQTAAAATAWSSPASAGPGAEATQFDGQTWARYTTEVTALREQLRAVPVEDRELWSHVARETAGAFAAWSLRVEDTPGPLADVAEILARSAQLRARQVRPQRAGLPSAKGAALLLASVAAGGSGTVAEVVLLRQLANTVKALHDAHVATGDAQRAAEINEVMTVRLNAVYARLPAAPASTATAGGDPQAVEAARVARQGQLPARAPGSPLPGAVDPPARWPVQRPDLDRDRSDIER